MTPRVLIGLVTAYSIRREHSILILIYLHFVNDLVEKNSNTGKNEE